MPFCFTLTRPQPVRPGRSWQKYLPRSPWAAAAGFAAKAIVAPTKASTEPPVDHMRDRLALTILTVGTSAIVVVSLAIVIVFARDYTLRTKLGEFGPTMFTTLVPVFSTWVGTVLAFYFSNESFRQATESTRSLFNRDRDDDIPIKREGIMVPYDKITKVGVVDEADARKQPVTAASFTDTASRLIFFDKGRHPLFVIRKKRFDAKPANATVDDYLREDGNKADATNFRFLSESASLADGLTSLEHTKASDFFITPRGDASEPVLGWVSDDALRGVTKRRP